MKKMTLLAATALLLCGCSTTPVLPEAQTIMVSTNPAPHSCKYLGQVVGNQGNFFTGSFTSNKNLEQGSMNDLKNQAAKMGANYIQIITSRAGATGALGSNGGSFMQTNVTNTGNVYNCPPAALNE
ncbi:MAG: DUF4156 domain-containing protein [Gammaproteobacteria bacterium]|nr:DUF4156 domain-containing protein [Gammaproteobacteria bacterium]